MDSIINLYQINLVCWKWTWKPQTYTSDANIPMSFTDKCQLIVEMRMVKRKNLNGWIDTIVQYKIKTAYCIQFEFIEELCNPYKLFTDEQESGQS